MLSLVAVVLAIILGVVIWKCNGKANKRNICIRVILVLGLLCILLLEAGLAVDIQMNNEAYLQSKIDTLTQENQMLAELREVIKEKLSDQPELLQHANTHLESELEENSQQLNRYLSVRDDILPRNRWLLYFG